MRSDHAVGERILSTNRFDLLRLLFASGVFVFHAWVLLGLAPLGETEWVLGALAELSIQGFFITSGALVYGSLERSQSLGLYAEKRVRRLYPAYAVVVIIPAIASLVLVGPGGFEAIGKYLAANLLFLNFLAPDLPALFQGQRFEEVNGALWTLKIEVMFYIALPLLALAMRWLGRAWWVFLILLYVLAELWRLCLPAAIETLGAPASVQAISPELVRQLPGQMAFFASGMALWKLWDTVKSRPLAAGLAGGVLFALSCAHPLLEPLRAAGLAGLIACAAFAPGPVLNAARFGDISYGVYITHFPILQAMIMMGLFGVLGLPAGFALAGVLVVGASFLLWWLVEKPVLRRDSHYRKAARGS